MKVIKTEINKCNLCILLIYICLTILTIVCFIYDYNIDFTRPSSQLFIIDISTSEYDLKFNYIYNNKNEFHFRIKSGTFSIC